MSVKTEFDFILDIDEFLDAQGESLRRAGMREAASRAFERGISLASPRMAFDWFPVEAVREREAEVGGVCFHLGRHADLLTEGREALVAVVTIGPALEEAARDLQGAGKALDAFLLGEAGVYVVGKLIEEAHHVAEAEAASRGWGVGAELAPGQLRGWEIGEQDALCGLVGVATIEVRVTGTGMLVPQKSASLMVGIGPGYTSTEVRSPCDFCAVSETCRFRH